MVQHGTQKKRRSGHKVKFKAPKHRRLVIKNALNNSDIQKIFENNKSPADNLEALGVIKNANTMDKVEMEMSLNKGQTKKTKKKAHAAFEGFAKMTEDSGSFTDPNPNRKKMSDVDMQYCKRNSDKHGEDYQAMMKDIKTNDRQLTAKKLQNLIEKSKSLN